MRDEPLTKLFQLALIGVLLLSLVVSAVWASDGPVWPQSGTRTRTDGNLTVDYTHSADGYIIVHSVKSKKKLKLRIQANGQTMDYDLNLNGQDEVFPLQMGNGDYSITLYKNAQGKSYSQDGRVYLSVTLNNAYAAELCPNQQISYTADSEAVKTSLEICQSLTTDRERFDAICKYVNKNMMYDYIKAVTVKSGTLPDIDGCFKSGMGICQDLSAITVCMLRVQGIPARMVVGMVDDKVYHAWVNALIDGQWEFYDPTVATNGLTPPKKYTAEKYY